MITNPELVEIILRFGPEAPLKNRVLTLLALDSKEQGFVDPDVLTLARSCKTKRTTIENVISELTEQRWLEPDLSGHLQVNPFPPCAHGTRKEGGLRALALSLPTDRLLTTSLVPTEQTVKLSPTYAQRKTNGKFDCEECGGTGWIEAEPMGSVAVCSCVEDDDG